MDLRDGTPVATLEPTAAPNAAGGRRVVWHALAVLLAAIVAWLVVAAYRQPELMLDLAAMRLC